MHTESPHQTNASPRLAPSDKSVRALAALFASGPVAVLTGAGVSTDSGIPDYRGAGSPPRTPMNITQFMNDDAYRRRFWAGARVGAERLAGVSPNQGHRALAALESAGRVSGIMTQNVDGLHRRAGSTAVVELHGNGSVIRCVTCQGLMARDDVLTVFDTLNPGFAKRHAGAQTAPDGDAAVADSSEVAVPACPRCGGVLRPDVVYFGEYVPRPVFDAAAVLVDRSEALILAGTSLAVNTGLRLVHRAERRGIPVGVINRGTTTVDARASVAVRIEGGTTETLTALTRELDGKGEASCRAP